MEQIKKNSNIVFSFFLNIDKVEMRRQFENRISNYEKKKINKKNLYDMSAQIKLKFQI